MPDDQRDPADVQEQASELTPRERFTLGEREPRGRDQRRGRQQNGAVSGRRAMEPGDQEQLKRGLHQPGIQHRGQEVAWEEDAAGHEEPERGEAHHGNPSQAELGAGINAAPEHHGQERLQPDPAYPSPHRVSIVDAPRLPGRCGMTAEGFRGQRSRRRTSSVLLLPRAVDCRRVTREQGVGRDRGRAGLGHEQRGEKERMVGNLDDPDLARAAAPAHPEAAVLEELVELGIDAVVAVVVLGGLDGTVEPCRQRTGTNDHGLLLLDERAREGGDDETLGVGTRFSMVGVSEPENIARELDDRVLEAASGADEGHAPLSRVADGRERPVHASIGARRRDPEPVE